MLSAVNFSPVSTSGETVMVKHISDRVAVMYGGKIVELAESEELYANPQHPYTKMLLQSIPIPDPAIEKQRKRQVMTEEELMVNRFNLDNTQLVEVSKDHWVAM